jgi:hypothetical protein
LVPLYKIAASLQQQTAVGTPSVNFVTDSEQTGSEQVLPGKKRRIPAERIFVPPRGISPAESTHQTKTGRSIGPGRLTCLSLGCLSSYLIFPPVPVTSKLRASATLCTLDAQARMDACAIANLTTDSGKDDLEMR